MRDNVLTDTAAKMFNVPPEEVTEDQKKRVKPVVNGLIYGAGKDCGAHALVDFSKPTEKVQELNESFKILSKAFQRAASSFNYRLYRHLNPRPHPKRRLRY